MQVDILPTLPGNPQTIRSTTEPDSAVTVIESIIAQAHDRRASDVHIDPGNRSMVVRLRVDGLLLLYRELPLSLHEKMIARLKVLAGLRTDEHYAAQDGRFKYDLSGQTWIDVRLAIVPTYYGENAVLRLLTTSQEALDLACLGFSEEHVAALTKAATQSHGLILVTGPTGSGKTTTLYALLRLITQRPLSVVTIEDPVEYSIDGVSQIPTNSRAGLTFAQGLRSILRQDPDVIMVGEIRDPETARLAASAALTGHLVLSTLHTHDASGALTRLIDLGVEPYLVASTVSLIVAQRLVRRICVACRMRMPIPAHEHAYLLHAFGTYGPIPKTVHAGNGCDSCFQSGYQGRTGVYELLPVSREIRTAICKRAMEDELRSLALQAGMKPLTYDGVEKIRGGTTSAQEFLRVHRYE